MSKDYENLMDSLTNTRYLDTPLEYFRILDDDVPEGSLRQQLAGGGVVTRQNFAKKGIAKAEPEEDFFKAPKDAPKVKGSILPVFSKKDKKTIVAYVINYYEPDDGKRSAKERRVVKNFGIKEYGNIEDAKKAAEAALENRPTDFTSVRRADVVRNYLNSYKKNNGFTGEEKFADNLRQYRGTSEGHTFEQINQDFKDWQAGKFEVDGIDRKTFDKQMNKDIKNWKTNLLSDRSIIRQKQFQFLDNLNTNSPDLDYEEVQKMFDKQFKNGPYWNEKTFFQRVGQLTQLKNEGKIPSNAAGTLFKDYGIKKGDRSSWLKKANGLQFGGNYERFIKASDILRERGQIKAADRLYKAAINFFGSGGIFTKLKGQGEHPLSTKYKGDIDAGDMNILKIDSLVEGDLNQLKRVIFDQPIIKLRAEYNKEGTTSARKEAIKKELNARKNFLNYLTSGSFDKGIVAPVEFKFVGDKLDYISNVTPIDELPNDYDFGKFVTKGDDYRSAMLKYGKEYNLLTNHPKHGLVIKRRTISADNIMSNVEALTKKLNLPIEEANEINKTI